MPYLKAKRTVFLFCVLFISAFNSLQAQVVLSEGFENSFPPANWTLLAYSSSNPWEQAPAGTGLNNSRSMVQYATDIASNAWIYTKAVTLTSGINYKLSYWYKIAPYQLQGKLKVVLTNGVPPTANITTTVLHDYTFITNSVYQQGTDAFTVPVSGNYYLGFNAYSSPNQFSLNVDSILLEQTSGTACSGTPPVGTPTAVSTICPDSTFVLSMTGIVPGAGVAYQWQVSDAGLNNFTNIAGGTTEKFTTTQSVNKDYRCIATCSFTGLSSTSNVISVTSPALCYCAPYGSDCTQDAIQNVTFGGINNSSGCGSPSGYSNYATSVAAATVAAGATVPIAVTVGNGQQEYLVAGIDFNKNGIFETGEVYLVGNGRGQTISSTIAIPATAPAGITRMRLRISDNYNAVGACVLSTKGEVEDYSVNITPYVCTGTPVPGFVSGPSYICSGTSFTLNVAGTFTGNQIQWESSPAGANTFTPIPGANAQSLTTSQTTSNDYRCKISCVAGGTSATSVIKQVTTPSGPCYCLISNGCSNANNNITNVTFGSINNTTTCLASGDYTTTVAAATVNAGASTPITVTVAGATSASAVAVWIDYNKNGNFETSEYTAVGSYQAAASFSANVFIPSNALPGNTRMRVMRRTGGVLTGTDACNAYTGDAEDYTVNIVAAPIAIYFTPFSDTLYNTAITVRARIVQKDVGLNTTDPLQPKLWAKRQGTTVWKIFKGQLANGTDKDGNWDFAVNNDSLGIRRNGCDSVQLYFVAQDKNTPVNIGYLPEVGALHTSVNTQVTPPNALFGYRLKPRMKDTIYVSAGDCRYRTLTDANGLFQDIKTKKLEGNLTILIESDLTENGLHELNKAGLNGFSISIKPATGTIKTISGAAYNAIIKMDNVKNVLIDGSFNGSGRYLKFINLATSSQLSDSINVVTIQNSCDSITIKNAILLHSVYLIAPPTAGESTLLMRNSNKNIFILNNYFANNTNLFPQRHIASAGGNNNITVKGNEFNNFAKYGIRMYGNCNNWLIDSNHFYRTTTPNYYTYDFSAISAMGGGHTISNNFIGGQAPFCAGGPMNFVDNPISTITGITAIGYYGNPLTTISGNTVDNITMGLTFAARASSFGGIAASYNTCIIKNNTVGNPQSTAATIIPMANVIFGITASGTGYAEIRDNIVTSMSNKQGAGPDFDNVSFTAIAKGDNAGQTNLSNLPNIISGNKVFNIRGVNSSSGNKTLGISCTGGFNNIVEKNMVYDISRESGTITGIQYQNGDSSGLTVIQRNRLYNFNNNVNAGGIINGIGLEEVRSSVDIINNQISLNNNDVARGTTINGIYENGPSFSPAYPGSKKRILYNTVRIGGLGTGTACTSAALFLGTASNGLNREVYNNIFYNERTGGTPGNFAISTNGNTQQPSLPNTRANYNYYVLADTSSFLIGTSVFGTITKNWSGWKSTYNFDDSSYIDLPANAPSARLFAGKATGNLNINFADSICWTVNDKAKPYALITADYDSAIIRSTAIANGPTDIGSDEFATNLPAPGSFCAGSGTSLTSNITGTTYQWQQKVGNSFVDIANNANYSGATTVKLALTAVPFTWNGQQYRCVVNGNTFSQIFTIIVNQSLTTTVAIATPSTTVCAGSTVTFTATVTNGGVAPVYQWKKNGQNTGTNSGTYTTNTLANGDIITAIVTTGLVCTTSPVTTSNAITMIVTPSLVTTASINGITEVPVSNPVTVLTLTVSNPGTNPTYQWQDSTTASGFKNISGATGTTLSYTVLVSGARVRCNVSSTNSCLGLNVAVSNTLQLTLKPGLVGTGFRYYPNPVRSIITVDSLSIADQWQTLDIVSAYGAQQLITANVSNLTQVKINVSTLPAGVYFAILTRSTGTREYFKFIKL